MSSNRKLRQDAAKLPPVLLFRNGRPVFEHVKRSGADILKENPKANVDPDMFYKVAKPVFRNHEKEMLAIWKKFGQEGVNNYIAVVMEQHRMATEKQIEVKMEKSPWWKQWWILFVHNLKEIKSLFKN